MRTKDKVIALIYGNNHALQVYETPYGKRVELYDATQENDWKHRKFLIAKKKYVKNEDGSSLPKIIKEFSPYYGEKPQIKLY